MKYFTALFGILSGFFGHAQSFESHFTLQKSIALSTDTIAPQHITAGNQSVYLITADTLYTADKGAGTVLKTPLDKSFKVGLLGKHLSDADSLYELPPMDVTGTGGDANKGGTITGTSAFGDTLVFTYTFTYGRKVGPNTVPAIYMYLGFFHAGELQRVVEITHGIVMSIDMPPYFINPSSFQMVSETEGVFSVTSLTETHPNLFSTFIVNKDGKLEMDRVLKPMLSSGLINERRELTLLGASQNFISLPFMGGSFSNEVWNFEKKPKMNLIPTKETPEIGIKLRLGKPVPPAFGVIDLIAVDDNEIKALILEKNTISLTHFGFKKSNVIDTKNVFSSPVEVEKLPNIGLLAVNQLYHFENNTLHVYGF